MKKYVLFIFTAAILFSMNVLAQAPQGNKGERKMPSPEMRANHMAKELGLTDDQKAKVQAVYEKNDAAFTQLRTEVKKDDPSFRTKFKALRDGQTKELKSIIGDEKYEQLMKLNKERMEKMKEKREANPN